MRSEARNLGKTTLRLLLAIAEPTADEVFVFRRRYRALEDDHLDRTRGEAA